MQSATTNTYTNVPAQFLHLEVLDLLDSDGEKITLFTDFFQAGPDDGGPLIREIDLLETAEEFKEYEAGEEEVIADEGNTGLQDEKEKEQEEEDLAEISAEVKGDQTTVRFQFDGKLTMKVTIDESQDKLTCENYDTSKYPKGENDARPGNMRSFHVINYMTMFNVRVDLEYEIHKEKNIYCDIVDDGLQVCFSQELYATFGQESHISSLFTFIASSRKLCWS